MRWPDWTIIVVILLSTIQAGAAGFFQEAFGIAGLVCGYLLAAWQYHRVAAWFGSFLKSQTVAEIAGFLTIFLGVIILAGMAGRIARWAVKESGLSFVDRILGGAIGLIRGDRKSTRLNSSHGYISYAVFCLKKKKIYSASANYIVVLFN